MACPRVRHLGLHDVAQERFPVFVLAHEQAPGRGRGRLGGRAFFTTWRMGGGTVTVTTTYSIDAQQVNTGGNGQNVQEIALRLTLPGAYEAAATFPITVDLNGTTDNPSETIVGLPTQISVDPPGEPQEGGNGTGSAPPTANSEGGEDGAGVPAPGLPVAVALLAGVALAVRRR